MTTVTVQVRLLKFGDVWRGKETVVGIANGFRPTDLDITLRNPDNGATRTVALHRESWFAVTREA